MSTIVNTPAQPAQSSGSGLGFLAGVILLIIFFGLALYYGLPALNRATSSPTINVPDQVDVNVNPGNQNNGGEAPTQ
ncbi:MAG: hypothetical protein KatS3mg087_0276 [Patescibacteria group bacterium]|nr:MAG: hypothetical protein KatS3mg087_0276 [Patescibacteria group bacterium]